LATTVQMLGKLETVFTYMTSFFLRIWPKDCSGLLFLTDSTGAFVRSVPFQPQQQWPPFPFAKGTVHDVLAPVNKAIESKHIVIESEGRLAGTCAVLPLIEKNGLVRGTVGFALPIDAVKTDLLPYIQTLDSFLRMGYDACIQQDTSAIATSASRYEHSFELMKYVVEQIAEMINKGQCLAFRLDHRGCIIPQERISSDGHYSESIQAEQVIRRLVNTRLACLADDRLIVSPIYSGEKPLYALVLHISDEDAHLLFDERDLKFMQTICEKLAIPLHRAMHGDERKRDAQKKDLLYELTKKIQATIDVHEVLEEIIKSIEQLYPYFTVDVYLSVETNTTLPIKPLYFQTDEDGISNLAYMEGRPVLGTEIRDGKQVTVLAAPLLGKQGIYGVLQLTTTELVTLLDNETNYITILAETAGTAFENAQLYQQSRNLIRELRLINEMAQQLNRSLYLDDILQFITTMLQETFQAEYSAILRQVGDSDTLEVLSSSREADKGKTILAREQPLLDLITDKRGIILANPDVETTRFSLTPFASMMGVPLLQESRITGVILVSDTRRHFFSFDDFKLLEIVAQHASLAVTNALLHSEVERMVITDNLTGLYARRYLNERVQDSLEQDEFGSLIVLDIDHFKKVNDTYGHQTGDEVLVQVAKVIKRTIGDSDIAARWGGEEMAIYLPKVDTPMALTIAERIRAYVELETQPKVTISSGVSKWDRQTHQNMSVELLFHNADVALYTAKRNGRNQVKFAYDQQ